MSARDPREVQCEVCQAIKKGKVTHETQDTHTARAYPTFQKHQATESIATRLPWMGCSIIAGLPLAVCCQYPFITKHDGKDQARELTSKKPHSTSMK